MAAELKQNCTVNSTLQQFDNSLVFWPRILQASNTILHMALMQKLQLRGFFGMSHSSLSSCADMAASESIHVVQDTRGDRQPSFTQMDLEMTFSDQDVIMQLTEALMRDVFQEVCHSYCSECAF